MSFYEISEQGIEVAQMAIAGSNKIVLCEQVLLQPAARTVTAVQPPSSQYLQAALRNLGSTPPPPPQRDEFQQPSLFIL